jgi:hypothetical protein
MRIPDDIADGLVILDRPWRLTDLNAHAAWSYGRLRSEVLGKCVWDLFPSLIGTEMARPIRRAGVDSRGAGPRRSSRLIKRSGTNTDIDDLKRALEALRLGKPHQRG